MASGTYVTTTLAQGQGHALGTASVRTALYAKENALPEKTRVELKLQFIAPSATIPIIGTKVGPVDLSGVAMMAVNWAHKIGRLVVGKNAVELWPGDTEPASHDGATHVTTIRWMKAIPGITAILAALKNSGPALTSAAAGTTEGAAAGADATAAAEAAGAAGLAGISWADIAILVAVVAGVLLFGYLTHWEFFKVVYEAAKAVVTGTVKALASPGADLVIGGIALVTLLAIARARSP